MLLAFPAACALAPLSPGGCGAPPALPAPPGRPGAARIPGGGSCGEPGPGEPRDLLRLRVARLAGLRARQHGDRRAVGARRARGNCFVRAIRAACGSIRRRCWCGAAWALVRWGAMAFDRRSRCAAAAVPARPFVRRHPSRRHRLLARPHPSELAASAQAYVAVAQGLVMAAAMALSGVLYRARWRPRLCGYGADCRGRWCLAVGFASTMGEG